MSQENTPAKVPFAQKVKDFRLMGLNLPVLAVLIIILVGATALGILPGGMVAAFLFLMVFGELLNWLGNITPIVNTFLGGGAIACIFGGAALVYFGIIPAEVADNISAFMKDSGASFLDFYIAALITGSILGMNRKLLINAAIRYLPCILGSVVFAIGLVSLGGKLFGMSIGEAVAYIGIPIMGGGMGAGAVPIAKVFEGALQIPADTILSKLVPAVALGNAFAIVCGGLLNRLGQKVPKLTGNGQLVISNDESLRQDTKRELNPTLEDFFGGIVISTGFYVFGVIVANLIGKLGLNIHAYAWMIIAVAVVKITGIMPDRYEDAASAWYGFVAKDWTAALMLGIGIAYTDLGQIIEAFSVRYVILVALTIIGAILGAGLVGRLVGFYPIESALTAGLCMANMGGTGDVAVLSAAHRMELMPFAQISSRLGGAFIILLASFLVPMFFG